MPTRQQQLMMEQQKKLARLQADNIIYQEEISRLRKRLIQLEQYRIKYQLLLEKQQQESPLQRSRRVDQINNMNRKIQQNNEKWTLKLKILQGKYQTSIHQLEQKNIELSQRNNQLVRQLENNQQQSPGKGQTNRLRQQLNRVNADNIRLRQQMERVRGSSSLINITEEQLQKKLQQARQQQKQFYRDNIIELQQQIKQLKQQVQYHRVRASPQRQQQIQRLIQQIHKLEQHNDQQIIKLTQCINSHITQQQHLKQLISTTKQQSLQTIAQLQSRLQEANHKVFVIQQQHHSELMQCRRDMEQLKDKEVGLLKQSFKKLQDSFDGERQQWKLILEEQEQQLNRVKKMWEDEKAKYQEEKNKLKGKINQLKERQKRTAQQQKQLADTQTFKMIQSLKQIDQQQNKFNDYQNGITFLHRQLKRSAVKLQQKQRQVTKLLQQLKTQRQQFQTETQFIKQTQRQHVTYYKQKLHQADQLNAQLMQQLREKQQQLQTASKDHTHQLSLLTEQNHQFQLVIEEMEKDYARVTDNKKDLYQNYRSERDMVFVGKAELGQERKKKWLQLDRQKNQLEIAYKERERQLTERYQLKVNELNQAISRISKEKELGAAEVEILKNQLKLVNDSSDHNGNINSSSQAATPTKTHQDLHKKLATLDLEINLTQNLFSTLQSLRQRTQAKSQLENLSMQSSQSLSEVQRQVQNLAETNDGMPTDNVAPTFARPQQFMAEGNFSFKPQQRTEIKVTNPAHDREYSFFPVDTEEQEGNQ